MADENNDKPEATWVEYGANVVKQGVTSGLIGLAGGAAIGAVAGSALNALTQPAAEAVQTQANVVADVVTPQVLPEVTENVTQGLGDYSKTLQDIVSKNTPSGYEEIGTAIKGFIGGTEKAVSDYYAGSDLGQRELAEAVKESILQGKETANVNFTQLADKVITADPSLNVVAHSANMLNDTAKALTGVDAYSGATIGAELGAAGGAAVGATHALVNGVQEKKLEALATDATERGIGNVIQRIIQSAQQRQAQGGTFAERLVAQRQQSIQAAQDPNFQLGA